MPNEEVKLDCSIVILKSVLIRNNYGELPIDLVRNSEVERDTNRVKNLLVLAMKRADGEINDKSTCMEVVKVGSTRKQSDVEVIDIEIKRSSSLIRTRTCTNHRFHPSH